ncbi:hypothetical protein ACFRAO_01200 [Streptomyces sp. NPDC056656]
MPNLTRHPRREGDTVMDSDVFEGPGVLSSQVTALLGTADAPD